MMTSKPSAIYRVGKGLIGCLALCLLACSGGEASTSLDASMVSEASEASTPDSLADTLAALSAFREQFGDPAARFSATAAYDDLNAWREVLEDQPDHAEDLRQVLYMTGSVVNRSATLPYEAGSEPMAELMAMGPGERTDERKFYDHYVYAQLLEGQAGMNDAETYRLSAEHFAKAAELSLTAFPDDRDRWAGTLERQGYALHAAGDYDAALRVNGQVLKEGERIHGASSPKLRVVLTNMAQNLHALGSLDEVEPVLIRAQSVAEAGGDDRAVQNMMFQRAVLAHERGQSDRASDLMTERLAFVRAMDDADLIAEAEADLAELRRREAE